MPESLSPLARQRLASRRLGVMAPRGDGTFHKVGLHMHYCQKCRKLFLAVRSDARYCSNACRQAAYRARRRKGRGVITFV